MTRLNWQHLQRLEGALQQFNGELNVERLLTEPNPFVLTDLQLAMLIAHNQDYSAEDVLDMADNQLKQLVTGEG